MSKASGLSKGKLWCFPGLQFNVFKMETGIRVTQIYWPQRHKYIIILVPKINSYFDSLINFTFTF